MTRVLLVGHKRLARWIFEWFRLYDEAEVAGIITLEDSWDGTLGNTAEQCHDPTNEWLGRPGRHPWRHWLPACGEVDILICAQFPYRLPPDLLDFKWGAWNIHYSLLPNHAGCDPVAHAILAGDYKTGVTIHRMTEEFDDGPIVYQTPVKIGSKSGYELYGELSETAFEGFKDQWPYHQHWGSLMYPQDLSKRVYHKKGELVYEKKIDPNDPLKYRKFQAFNFPPFQVADIAGP